MADPNWKNGFYYDGLPPHTGMKLARREPFYNGLRDYGLMCNRDRHYNI